MHEATKVDMNEEQRATDTRELMIRLDERLKGVQATLNQIQITMSSKVENDAEYKQYITRTNKMWDLQNKAMGYIAAWTAVISLGIYFLGDYIKGILGK